MKTHKAASEAFGQVLKKYRLKRKLSKQGLAYEAALDVATIKRIEKGESGVSLDTLITLASALGVSASQLIKETEARLLINKTPT